MRGEWPLQVAVLRQDQGVLGGAESPAGQVSDADASGNERMQQRQRNHVLLCGKHGVHESMHRPAASNGAWNLRDHKSRELQIGMLFAVLRQRLGHVLGRRDVQIGNHASPGGLWVVEIDGFPNEVRAIARDQFIRRPIRSGIVRGDKSIVLFGGGDVKPLPFDFQTHCVFKYTDDMSQLRLWLEAAIAGVTGAR